MQSMNNMGGPQQQRKGYYRPRNNQGYKGQQNINKGQYGQQQQQQQQQRRGGATYFPQAPMYGDAPYGMPAYGQPPHGGYAPVNIHQPMQNNPNPNPPPNVSAQGRVFLC